MFDENHAPYWARASVGTTGITVVEGFVTGKPVFIVYKLPRGEWAVNLNVTVSGSFAKAKLHIQAMVEVLRLVDEIDTGVKTQAFVQAAPTPMKVARELASELLRASSKKVCPEKVPSHGGGRTCPLPNLHCSWPKCEQ